MRLFLFRCLGLFVVYVCSAVSASAQSWTAAGSSPFLWSNQSPLGVYRSVNTMMLSRLPSGQQATPSAQRMPLSATSFARTRTPLMPQRMAGPADENRAQRLQAYGAILASYDQLLKDSGEFARLGSNVAGAITYLLVSSHYVLSGGTELPTAQQELILQDLNDALAQTPAFASMSDAQKQELFETCAITGSYALTLYRTGVDQKNPSYVKEARNLASLGVEQILGVKPERVSLGQGLRLR